MFSVFYSDIARNRNYCRTGSNRNRTVCVCRKCCRRYFYSACCSFKHACSLIVSVECIAENGAVVGYSDIFQYRVEYVTQNNIVCLRNSGVALVGNSKGVGYLTVLAYYCWAERLFNIKRRSGCGIYCFCGGDRFCNAVTRYRDAVGYTAFNIERSISRCCGTVYYLRLRVCRNVYSDRKSTL